MYAWNADTDVDKKPGDCVQWVKSYESDFVLRVLVKRKAIEQHSATSTFFHGIDRHYKN